MRKLFWILRYAQRMNNQTHCGMKYAIYDAKIYVAEIDDWHEYTPQEAADESISCWDIE